MLHATYSNLLKYLNTTTPADIFAFVLLNTQPVAGEEVGSPQWKGPMNTSTWSRQTHGGERQPGGKNIKISTPPHNAAPSVQVVEIRKCCTSRQSLTTDWGLLCWRSLIHSLLFSTDDRAPSCYRAHRLAKAPKDVMVVK